MRVWERGNLTARAIPARVTVTYLAVGMGWIIVSDQLLYRFGGIFAGNLGSTIKGLIYVGVTATVLYLYSRRLANEIYGSHQRLQATLESIGDAVIATDSDGLVFLMNPVAEQLTGFASKDAVGRRIEEVLEVLDDKGSRLALTIRDAGQADSAVRFEGTIRKVRRAGPRSHSDDVDPVNHQERYVSGLATPMLDSLGSIVGVVCVLRDITERIRGQQALRQSQREYRLLFTTMSEAFAIVECEEGDGSSSCTCRVVEVNPAFEALVGRESEQLIGLELCDICPERRGEWTAVVERVMRTGRSGRFEGRLPRYEKYVRGIAYRAPRNRIAIILIDDTERRQIEERVEYLSYHDRLTGLHNRAYLEDRLAEMNADRDLTASVIIADVDGLKLVNDTFGHTEGDAYLRSVATALENCCSEDSVVARWGGDEFAILLPNTTELEADEIVRRIERTLSSQHHIRLGGEPATSKIPVGITLGHATRTDPREDLAQTMRRAESEMYKRKFLHRTNVRNSMINSLREMLDAKTHETHEHATRLHDLALEMSKRAGLSERDQNELSLLAMLHDIGKIGIPDRILEKPGPLTDDEWEIMKTHCVIGYRIASATPDLAQIATAILHHHERWDGTGYPEGLAGEQIPVICRIVAIVDAFDAMTNDRVYRSARSAEEALAEIRANAGKQFDPELVELFVGIMACDTEATG